MKKLLFALAGIVLAASALAEFTKYKDWDKGPEAYFLTPTERAEWKNLASDEDAEKFILLYYARRGGDSFKQEISRRIAAADQQFKMLRYKRGADSVRGHLLVVLGTPSRVSQSRAQGGGPDLTGGAPPSGVDAAIGASAAIYYTWTYAADKFPPGSGITDLKADITVDPAQGRDTLGNPREVEKAMATLAENSIVNPKATLTAAGVAAGAGAAAATSAAVAKVAPAVPAAAAGAGGAVASAVPAAAAAPTMLPAAVKAALESVAGKTTGEAGFWSGAFRSAAGDSFLAFQFYLASNKPEFASPGPLKFGGLVTDEAGKEVDSFWEDAALLEVAEGARKDRVFDRSVTLQPGNYKGVFGLFPAEGQPPVASASVNFKLDPRSTDFGVSPLILSNGLIPLTKRPGPADPFVFGVEKPIKVEPKGDRLFSKTDSLWYFYGVENPSAPAPAADAAATPAAEAPAADAPKPRIQAKINVQRDGKDAFAPFTGPADLVQTSPGFFSSGSEIPLASFEPGYYTFVILVRDLNAVRGSEPHKGYERKQDFIVLMADGSLPAKTKPVVAPVKTKKP